MTKQHRPKRVLFARILMPVLFGVFSVIAIAASAYFLPATKADATTNSTINFQARLLTSSGGIVPDGTYNVEFKLYNASTLQSGQTQSPQGACTGDANCLWVETRTSGNKVTVRGGYLSVALGSVNAFPTTINWDQNLWLTMNVGGTGTPGWDGEMNPRLAMTGVPYAFRAGTLAQSSGSNEGTLSFGTISGTDAITLPDASGIVCLQSSSACGFELTSGTDFIRNQSGQQTNAQFNIQAPSSQVAATIQGASGKDIADFVLSGGGNALAINSAGALVVAGGLSGGDITTSGASTATGITIQPGASSGASATGASLTLTAGSAGGVGVAGTGGTLTISGGSAISTGPAARMGGNVAINAGAGSNSSGIPVNFGTISIGTTSTSGITIGSSAAAATIAGNATVQGSSGLTLGSTTNTGLLNLLDGTSDGFTATLKLAGALGSSQNYLLPTTGGTICIQGGSGCGGSSTAFVQNGNAFGAQAVLGTTDNNSLALETNGVSRVVLDTSGNLTFQQASTISTSTGNLTVQANGTSTLTLGTTGAGTVNIAPSNATAVNIATASGAAQTITEGSSNAGTSVTLQGGNIKEVLSNNNGIVLQGTSSTYDGATVGSEMITASESFPTTTGWTAISGTGTSATATHTNGGGTTALSPTPALSIFANNYYQVNYTVTSRSNGSVTASLGGATGEVNNSGSSYDQIFFASTTANLAFTPTNGFDGTISAVSVKQLTFTNQLITLNDSTGAASVQVAVNAANLNNTFYGIGAGPFNSTGTANTAFGAGALDSLTVGSNNTAIGYQAMQLTTNGTKNTALGYQALQNNLGGANNVAVGYTALQSNITGNFNTALGYQSLSANTTGAANVAIGENALFTAASASNNVAIGTNALRSIVSNGNNVGIGNSAGYQDVNGTFATGSSLQNAVALGAFAQVQASNAIVLGSVDNATNVGIGITVPSNTFSVSPLDYQTGTATRTNGSATLVGTGTTWTSAMVGDIIVFADGTTNTVAAFTNTTHITMGTTYTGTTDASPVSYRLHHVGLQVTSAGNVYIQGGSSSLFQVENAAGTNLLAVDTSGNNVNIGATSSAAIASTINIGTSSSSSNVQTVNIGSNGDTSNKVTIDGGTGSTAIQIGNSNTAHGIQIGAGTGNETVTLGSGSSTSTTTIQGGTGGVAMQTGSISGNTGSIVIQTGNSSTGTAGNITIDNGTGALSTGANVENDTFEGPSLDNWTVSFDVTSLTSSSTQAHSGSDSLTVVGDGTGSWGIARNFPGVTAVPGQIYDFTLWVRATATETIFGTADWIGPPGGSAVNFTGTATSTGWTKITASGLAPSGTTQVDLNLATSGAPASTTAYIDDIVITGQTVPAISIGTANAQGVVIGNSSASGATTLQGGSGGIDLNANGAVAIASTSFTFTPTSDSASAFVVQNSSSSSLFTVDSTNGRVIVGTGSTGESTAKLLVLDNGTSWTDPTGVSGAMYFNTQLDEYRCYFLDAWGPCGIPPIDQGFEIQDDFLGGGNNATGGSVGQLGWNGIAVNSNSDVVGYNNGITPSANHPGILRLQTPSAVANSGDVFVLSDNGQQGALMLAAGDDIKSSAAVSSTSSTTGQILRIGVTNQFSSTSTARPTAGVWWEADTSNNSHWVYCYGGGSGATCASSGISIAANTFYRLEITITATGSGTSAATFTINGTSFSVSGGTIDSTDQVSPSMACTGLSTTQQTCNIDYYDMRGYTGLR